MIQWSVVGVVLQNKVWKELGGVELAVTSAAYKSSKQSVIINTSLIMVSTKTAYFHCYLLLALFPSTPSTLDKVFDNCYAQFLIYNTRYWCLIHVSKSRRPFDFLLTSCNCKMNDKSSSKFLETEIANNMHGTS